MSNICSTSICANYANNKTPEHADYYGRQGLVIIKTRDSIIMANPGDFRIEVDAAKSGGVSDSRNGTMLKMFNLIDTGERSGSGIPLIFGAWHEQGWMMPAVTEQLEPERTLLTLTFKRNDNKKSAIKIGDKKSVIKIGDKYGEKGIQSLILCL